MFKKIVSLSKSELKQMLDKENSCVVLKNAVIDVFLVPCYLNDVRAGLKHALNRKLKTYDSKLEGIILGYDKIKVDVSEGKFAGRNAEVSYPVHCDCYVFQPVVGKPLEGIVNRMSDDHVGCVCHKYFNATIKRPEDTGYELWQNKKIYLNQSITFRVTDLDYTGLIPVIKGEFDDFKKYFPQTYAASSESGIEDITVSKKTNKKKKSKIETAVNSTQIPSTKFQDNYSDSGLDFDFLSPIPTPADCSKLVSKKRKKSPEPGPSKVPEKKKKKLSAEAIDPDELRKRLLEERKNSLLAIVPDEPVPLSKKRVKKSVDSPSKKTNTDIVPSKQLLITSYSAFNPAADARSYDVKPDVVPLTEEVEKNKSPKKPQEQKSPGKKNMTPKKSLEQKSPKEPQKKMTQKKPPQQKSPKEPQKNKSPKKSTPSEPIEPVASIADKGKVTWKIRDMEKPEEQTEPIVENGVKATKKPRKTIAKKPAALKKPKKNDDPAVQMEFYLKKMMELAKKSKDSSLLQNMLNLNLELKEEKTT